jgi:hypothetical protein
MSFPLAAQRYCCHPTTAVRLPSEVHEEHRVSEIHLIAVDCAAIADRAALSRGKEIIKQTH